MGAFLMGQGLMEQLGLEETIDVCSYILLKWKPSLKIMLFRALSISNISKDGDALGISTNIYSHHGGVSF